MTDYTSSLGEVQVGRSGDSVGRWVVKKLTFTATGIGDQGTHNVITIPAKNFVAMGFFVVTTSLVSDSSSGTILFQAGEAMHTAITADGTELAAKDVVFLSPGDYEDTIGLQLYNSSADTLDIVVATNDITSGVGYLIVLLIDLTNE